MPAPSAATARGTTPRSAGLDTSPSSVCVFPLPCSSGIEVQGKSRVLTVVSALLKVGRCSQHSQAAAPHRLPIGQDGGVEALQHRAHGVLEALRARRREAAALERWRRWIGRRRCCRRRHRRRCCLHSASGARGHSDRSGAPQTPRPGLQPRPGRDQSQTRPGRAGLGLCSAGWSRPAPPGSAWRPWWPAHAR